MEERIEASKGSASEADDRDRQADDYDAAAEMADMADMVDVHANLTAWIHFADKSGAEYDGRRSAARDLPPARLDRDVAARERSELVASHERDHSNDDG